MADGTCRASTRAMSPVVGKALEATLVVLYIGLVTTTLYGGAVPEYRHAAGSEVAERVVADAATDIESAIPPEATAARVRLEVDLPPSIAGDQYRVRAARGHLVLEHPDPSVATRVPLVLPDRVTAVTGTWEAGDDAAIDVETTERGLEVSLT